MDDAVSTIFECLCHGVSLAKTVPLSSQTTNCARVIEIPGEESLRVFLARRLGKTVWQVIDVKLPSDLPRRLDVGEPALVLADGKWGGIAKLTPVP